MHKETFYTDFLIKNIIQGHPAYLPDFYFDFFLHNLEFMQIQNYLHTAQLYNI